MMSYQLVWVQGVLVCDANCFKLTYIIRQKFCFKEKCE